MIMEGLSVTDVVMLNKHNNNRGMSGTALGLAAGLGGGALLLGIAGLWGMNQASKARAKAASEAAAGNQKSIDMVSQLVLSERASRESWQNVHTPTIRNYVDVQAGAGAGANANALAAAYAVNGINAAIGHDSYLKVQRYSAPQPCGCDTCN